MDALHIAANRVVPVQNQRRQGTGNGAADHGKDTDDKSQRGVHSLACLQLNILQHICLEHIRQQIGGTKLQADQEQEYDKHDLERTAGSFLLKVGVTDQERTGVGNQ